MSGQAVWRGGQTRRRATEQREVKRAFGRVEGGRQASGGRQWAGPSGRVTCGQACSVLATGRLMLGRLGGWEDGKESRAYMTHDVATKRRTMTPRAQCEASVSASDNHSVG